MIGAFSTNTLARVVSSLTRPSSFLLDAFFLDVQTEEDSEEIHFDVLQNKPRIAPFVSPLVEGKIVQNEGFTTNTFRPAYVKDKRVFNPKQALRRTAGEQIGGSITPAQRRDAAIGQTLVNQLEMLTRREEVMASEVLRTGVVTVAGDGYPTKVVDFGRAAGQTITLAGGAAWDDTPEIMNNLEDWSKLVSDASGAGIVDWVMDPLAWRLMRNDADFKTLLETRRGSMASAEIGPLSFDQNTKARKVGEAGSFNFWVYSDTYVDDAGVTQKILPDNTIVGASPEMLGTRCYGVVQDEEANFAAERFFSKSWLEKDPARRLMMMQSAPLVVPYRASASIGVTVA